MLRNKGYGLRVKGYGLWVLVLMLAGAAQAQDNFIYDAKGKRNPFIPLVTADGRILKLDKEDEQQGDIAIEGIIFDQSGRSFAIINGEVVATGDSVGADYRILKIETNKVILIKDGAIREVLFNKEGS
jgi:hypothetical protein